MKSSSFIKPENYRMSDSFMDGNLSSPRKIDTTREINQITKNFSQLIEEVVEEIYKIKNPDEMIITFSKSIIEEYRRMILEANTKETNPLSLSKIESQFNKTASKTMEFLSYTYPQPKGSIPLTESRFTETDIPPRHNLVRKLLDHPFRNENNSEMRIDINTLLYNMICSSEDQFHVFEEKMNLILNRKKGSTPQNGDISADISASFQYRFHKRLSKGATFSSMDFKSPAFHRVEKETISVLMDWFHELTRYFINPSKLIDRKKGFRNAENGVTNLTHKERVRLSKLFETNWKDLERELEKVKTELREIIRSIILISERPLKREEIDKTKQTTKEGDSESELIHDWGNHQFFTFSDIHYLEHKEISFIKICDDIYKTVNDHIMRILTIAISHVKKVEDDYFKQSDQSIADLTDRLDLVTFTIPNLYQCECLGTKQDIESMGKMIREQKGIQIISYTDRTQSEWKDIIIYLTMDDPKMTCSFICEVRLSALQTGTPFSFPNFLLQLSETPFGIIAELGLLFQSLDKRNKYIKKNHIVYEKENKSFKVSGGTQQKVTCLNNPSHLVSKLEISCPFICNICFKYRYAYIFPYESFQCSNCQTNICQICYLGQLSHRQDICNHLLTNDLSDLKSFYQLKHVIFTQEYSNEITQYLKKLFNSKTKTDEERERMYYGVLKIEYNSRTPEFNIVKYVAPLGESKNSQYTQQWDKKEKEYMSFNNLSLNFTCKNKCLFLILEPKFRPEMVSQEQYLTNSNKVTIESLHQRINTKPKKKCIIYKEEGKIMLIDYEISKEKIYQEISDNMAKIKLKSIEKSDLKDQTLRLNNFALNCNIFNNLSEQNKVKITSLNIRTAFEHLNESNQQPMKLVENFSNLKILKIDSTEVPIPQLDLPQVEELYLTKCKEFEGFQLNDYKKVRVVVIRPYHVKEPLPKLNLEWLQTLQIGDTYIPSFEALEHSNIKSIDRIKIINIGKTSLSTFTRLPIFRGDTFNNLKTLQYQGLREFSDSQRFTQNHKEYNIRNLQILILEYSNITGVFPRLDNLPCLQQLRLGGNKLTGFQDFQSKILLRVDLSYNNLTTLPRIISPSLIQYKMIGNKLTTQGVRESLSMIHSKRLFLTLNPEQLRLPLVRTNVHYIQIESSKLDWEIADKFKIDPNVGFDYFCDGTDDGEVILSISKMALKITKRGDYLDFCVPCWEKLKQIKQEDWEKNYISGHYRKDDLVSEFLDINISKGIEIVFVTQDELNSKVLGI